MMLKPIGSRILVEPEGLAEKTASGILLPETAKEKPQRGKVIAVGDGRFLDSGEQEKTSVVVGSVVYFSKYGPTEIEVDGRGYYIIGFDDVLAVETN